MNNRIFISDKELGKYGEINNYSQKAEALLKHQKEHWELLNNNFAAFDNVQTKKYDFNGLFVKTQFNPSRIISSSAKVDKKSIAERACFLCEKNLPEVQKGIHFKNNYTILCNPYPVFKQHLTIPHIDHTPQNIDSSFRDLLEISFELKDNFFVFYNGPKCGASAPDHLHFQAGLKNSTPLEEYYTDLIENGKTLFSNGTTAVNYIDNELFGFISIQSNRHEEIENYTKEIINRLKAIQEIDEEPLLNIICFYENDLWNVFIIPRKTHRPKEYFLEGDEKLLISPASVDMAGLLITPRKEDFDKLASSVITSIYSQVLMDDGLFEKLRNIF